MHQPPDPSSNAGSSPRSRSWLCTLAALLLAGAGAIPCLADSSQDGLTLASELRNSVPRDTVDVQGRIQIRDEEGRRRSFPFRYRVAFTSQGWLSIYETQGDQDTTPPQRLTVIHQPDQPNQYVLETTPANGDEPTVLTLEGQAAMVPFAGSDFWLTDLGLDYLHWPEHRIDTKTRLKMRKGRPCQVLESNVGTPHTTGYTRVRSWIDRETGKPILAEAYGPDGKRLKEFEVGGVTKVDGIWELKNLEMRDLAQDSRTLLEFQYRQRE